MVNEKLEMGVCWVNKEGESEEKSRRVILKGASVMWQWMESILAGLLDIPGGKSDHLDMYGRLCSVG